MPTLREEAKHTHTHPTTDGDGKRCGGGNDAVTTNEASKVFYFEALLTRRVPYPKLRLEGTAKSKPCKRRR